MLSETEDGGEMLGMVRDREVSLMVVLESKCLSYAVKTMTDAVRTGEARTDNISMLSCILQLTLVRSVIADPANCNSSVVQLLRKWRRLLAYYSLVHIAAAL